jgi:hypothetical protein
MIARTQVEWQNRSALGPVFSCHTDIVLKNVTITLPEEVAHWARKKAADENTSVSRLVAKMLEAQMRQTDDFQEAYRRWQNLEPVDIDAEHRLSREDAHARR